MLESAKLKFIAEDTLLIEFGDRLDDEIYQRVLRLDSAISASALADDLETLPTFRSLAIRFDAFRLSSQNLLDALSSLEASNSTLVRQRWRVPVCFEGECAQDMPEVATRLGLTAEEIVRRLLASPLKLYMYGFAPGFAYLGGLDKKLSIARRNTPRTPMPRGALMIAGGLASLTSVSIPTGWYVLGQTPLTMFSLQRKSLVPFAVGDELRLYQVSPQDFEMLLESGDMAGVEKISP